MLTLTYALIAAIAGALRTDILSVLMLIDEVFRSIELLLVLILKEFLLMLTALVLIDAVFRIIELLLVLMLTTFALIDEVLIDMFVEI